MATSKNRQSSASARRIANEVEPVLWKSGRLKLLDQRKLPHVETWIELHGAADTARAIRDMVVRGAPAIGVTAAFGLVLASRGFRPGRVLGDFEKAAAVLAAARPTAVNLAWAVRRVLACAATALMMSRRKPSWPLVTPSIVSTFSMSFWSGSSSLPVSAL